MRAWCDPHEARLRTQAKSVVHWLHVVAVGRVDESRAVRQSTATFGPGTPTTPPSIPNLASTAIVGSSYRFSSVCDMDRSDHGLLAANTGRCVRCDGLVYNPRWGIRETSPGESGSPQQVFCYCEVCRRLEFLSYLAQHVPSSRAFLQSILDRVCRLAVRLLRDDEFEMPSWLDRSEQ